MSQLLSLYVFTLSMFIFVSNGVASSGANCTMIPSGSVINGKLKNTTLYGETPCDCCSFSGKGGASQFSCSGTTGKYMTYSGNNCDGTPVTTEDVTIKGRCYNDRCIGYNDIMYKYTGTSCQGEVMSNTSLCGAWSPLNKCMQVNSVDIVIETCTDGIPVCEVWHPPNTQCQGPVWGNITYNNSCTPPYDGHTELLTMFINPCS
eukprot:230391_1